MTEKPFNPFNESGLADSEIAAKRVDLGLDPAPWGGRGAVPEPVLFTEEAGAELVILGDDEDPNPHHNPDVPPDDEAAHV